MKYSLYYLPFRLKPEFNLINALSLIGTWKALRIRFGYWVWYINIPFTRRNTINKSSQSEQRQKLKD